MLLTEVFTQAYASLREHRFRAGLTMLGIAWGIVTVVVLMAYGHGFRQALVVGFRNAISDGAVLVGNGQTSLQAGGERAGRRIWIKEDDVAAILELGTVKYASPEYLESLPVSYGTRQTTAGVRGVAPEYGLIRSEIPADGRFLNAEDVDKRRRVVFLGDDVARKLFSNEPPVGRTVRISGLTFEVVGVLAKKAQIMSYFYPDSMSVFVPYTTIRQLFVQNFVDYVIFESVEPSRQQVAVKQVRELLAVRHRFDPRDERAIEVNLAEEITDTVDAMAAGLMIVLVFIGALTLLIGGVGVMNIMLVSVQERTREIGVRKAVGARRRDILKQFLLEALGITFTGGIAGILLSFAVVKIVRSRPFLAGLLGDSTGQTDIHLMLSPDVVITATVVLVVTGVLSGLLPALRAARLDPIESLRYE